MAQYERNTFLSHASEQCIDGRAYYLDQQQGRGMPVFRGSLWQAGHGQHGYGLGGLFRSIARVAMPTVLKLLAKLL